jgi:hypothetical protein
MGVIEDVVKEFVRKEGESIDLSANKNLNGPAPRLAFRSEHDRTFCPDRTFPSRPDPHPSLALVEA